MGRVNYPDLMHLISNPQSTDMVSSLLKGYKTGAYPAQQKEEQRQRMIQSQLQQYQLNDYPERSQLELEKMRTENQYLSREKEAAIQRELELANYYRRGGGRGGAGSGYSDHPGLPPGAIPYSDMTVGEKTQAFKEQQAALHRANVGIEIEKELDDFDKLVKENPDMATDLTSAFLAGEEPGVISALFRKTVGSEKKYAATIKANKIGSKLVLLESQRSGASSKAATDNLRQMWADTKVNATNPLEANKYLSQKLRQEVAHSRAYKEAIQKGMGGAPGVGRYYVPEDADYYNSLANGQSKSQSSNARIPMKGKDGKIHNVLPEDVDDFNELNKE